MRPIITVENLSKQYSIGAQRARYLTLRESLMNTIRSPLKRLSRNGHADDNRIWALKDISFDVKPGEILGVIGCNGAGKSTLLKVLSRVTEPTTGAVDIYGRVGSLLEVGTGFHPELTGRENLYLSGAILGMSKREINRKFDEIVAFAEIEKFLDTPVKYYSSGMYIRLAFSVAIQLEPEVLLVDEVLAVGDLAFQQKCLNYMKDLTESGMTILLVSHNMAAIQSCCTRALLMEKGAVIGNGEPVKIIESYRQALQLNTRKSDHGSPSKRGALRTNSIVDIVGFEMYGEDGNARRNISFGESVRIRIDLDAKQRIQSPMINFGIKRGDGVSICNFNNWYDNFKIDYIEGPCTLEGWLPPLRLVPDFYEIHVLVWPWAGNHVEGSITGSTPYAATIFGDFSISGPALNSHDGVFQQPATRWRFSRHNHAVDFQDITSESLQRAFEE